MLTALRRLVWLAVLGGAGYAAWIVWRGRTATAPAMPTASAAASAEPPEPPEPAWVDPDDAGGCPVSHPVKANGNSGIFHMPGGRFYDRTKAERCYADESGAEADGFRRSKS